ncbi:MAG: hypothetical protein Q8J68_07715 [Methanolobus sp.]|uniref:hypothetical protein n=1 Tax=Methanolobus sp. TaxID=1874737 RepID=UPI0027309000|nr:hypothetical protein [Methanolobus sp.]MDP2217154.1 hypothetical protein [Methanolobus sp.]
MTVIRYGSFNRPLDFINKEDFLQEIGISHNALPIKKGLPFSIIVVKKLLPEDIVYRYELRLMDYENIHAKCTECNGNVYLQLVVKKKLVCEYDGEFLSSRCWEG